MIDYRSAKETGRNGVKAHCGVSIGAFILFFVLTTALSRALNIYDYLRDWGILFLPFVDAFTVWAFYPAFTTLFRLFISAPATVGYSGFALRAARQQPASIRDMFRAGFVQDYWRSVAGIFYVRAMIFLWSLLLIIPGIIKAYAYAMTPYILADCPDVPATDALQLSQRMTKHYKGDIFTLQLSFIGWWLLGVLTLGLVWILYAGPYYHTSMAAMYDRLKAHALHYKRITPEELGIKTEL